MTTTSEFPVRAATAWTTNADLIADCARLGYLHTDWRTLDPTWGAGTWWKKWRPLHLTGHDIDPAKAPDGRSTDFRDLPHPDGRFLAVAFDPPYKLNGTPTHEVDDRYGVAGGYTSRADRHQLMLDGAEECARVLAPGGYLLWKCQDQVNGGHVRWQTDLATEKARRLGLTKVDALLMLGGRPQSKDRRQLHARRNYSSLLIFRKPR